MCLFAIALTLLSGTLGYFLGLSNVPETQQKISFVEKNNIPQDIPTSSEIQCNETSTVSTNAIKLPPVMDGEVQALVSDEYRLFEMVAGVYRFGEQGYENLLNTHNIKNGVLLFEYYPSFLVEVEQEEENFIYSVSKGSDNIEKLDNLRAENFRQYNMTYSNTEIWGPRDEELYAIVEENLFLARDAGDIREMTCQKYKCSMVFSALDPHTEEREKVLVDRFYKIALGIKSNNEGFKQSWVNHQYNATEDQYYLSLAFSKYTEEERMEQAVQRYHRNKDKK
jgi:hypothetical protein